MGTIRLWYEYHLFFNVLIRRFPTISLLYSFVKSIRTCWSFYFAKCNTDIPDIRDGKKKVNRLVFVIQGDKDRDRKKQFIGKDHYKSNGSCHTRKQQNRLSFGHYYTTHAFPDPFPKVFSLILPSPLLVSHLPTHPSLGEVLCKQRYKSASVRVKNLLFLHPSPKIYINW